MGGVPSWSIRLRGKALHLIYDGVEISVPLSNFQAALVARWIKEALWTH